MEQGIPMGRLSIVVQDIAGRFEISALTQELLTQSV